VNAKQSPTHERQSSILVLLLGAGTLVGLQATNLLPWLLEGSVLPLLLGLAGLGGVILLLALRVVHYADALAIRLGEPFGTLILTGSAVVVELALIASTMGSGEANPTLARDSMFAVLMIALTGIKGFSVFKAAREQEKTLQSPVQDSDLAAMNLGGSMTYVNLITTISVLALIVPNFTTQTTEANFNGPENLILIGAALGLFSVFIAFQTGSYRGLFTESRVQGQRLSSAQDSDEGLPQIAPAIAWLAAGLLILVLNAESMGQLIEAGLNGLGLRSAIGGTLVGLLVLAPEALNALRAASRGQVQRSLNTLYGSVLSTLCLTIPAVLLIGELVGTKVILGLDPLEMVLLGLTLLLIRPNSGKLTQLDGLMLLVVFVFWIALQVI
jgi:Ca2+:H+ antiporter